MGVSVGVFVGVYPPKVSALFGGLSEAISFKEEFLQELQVGVPGYWMTTCWMCAHRPEYSDD